jgi:threonine/homoserine/homoserine lactone efflux protein
VSYTIFELIVFGFTAFLVGFSGAVVPGPMLTVSVAESLKTGYKAGTSVVFGHVVAEIGMVVLLSLGLSHVIGLKAPFVGICIIGGVFLVFSGINLMRSCRNGISVDSTAKKTAKMYKPIYHGTTASLSNPYFFMWWFTVGAAFVLEGLRIAGLVGLVSFLIGHWASDFSWYGFVSICTEKGSALLGSKAYEFILIGCSAFLSALGVVFVYSGIVHI